MLFVQDEKVGGRGYWSWQSVVYYCTQRRGVSKGDFLKETAHTNIKLIGRFQLSRILSTCLALTAALCCLASASGSCGGRGSILAR